MSRLNQTLTNVTLLKNIIKNIHNSEKYNYDEKQEILKDFNKNLVLQKRKLKKYL